MREEPGVSIRRTLTMGNPNGKTTNGGSLSGDVPGGVCAELLGIALEYSWPLVS